MPNLKAISSEINKMYEGNNGFKQELQSLADTIVGFDDDRKIANNDKDISFDKDLEGNLMGIKDQDSSKKFSSGLESDDFDDNEKVIAKNLMKNIDDKIDEIEGKCDEREDQAYEIYNNFSNGKKIINKIRYTKILVKLKKLRKTIKTIKEAKFWVKMAIKGKKDPLDMIEEDIRQKITKQLKEDSRGYYYLDLPFLGKNITFDDLENIIYHLKKEGKLLNLKKLVLNNNTNLKKLPDLSDTGIVNLKINNHPKIKKIDHNYLPKGLKVFELIGVGIEKTPNLSNTLIYSLEITNCKKVKKINTKYLPKNLGIFYFINNGIEKLPNLSKTKIIIFNFKDNKNLKEVNISYLPKGSRLNDIALILTGSGIEKLPDISFLTISELNLRDCKNLREVNPNFLPKGLKKINLSGSSIEFNNIMKILEIRSDLKIEIENNGLMEKLFNGYDKKTIDKDIIKKIIKEKEFAKKNNIEMNKIREFFTLVGDNDKKIKLLSELVFKENLSITIGKKLTSISFLGNLNIYAGIARTIEKHGNEKNITLQNIIDKYQENLDTFIEQGKKYYETEIDQDGNKKIKLKRDKNGKKILDKYNNKIPIPNKDNYVIYMNHPIESFKKDGKIKYAAFTKSNNNQLRQRYESLKGEKGGFENYDGDSEERKKFATEKKEINNDPKSKETVVKDSDRNIFLENTETQIKNGKNIILHAGGHGDKYGNINMGNYSITKPQLQKLFDIKAGGKLTITMTSCNNGFKYSYLYKIAKDNGIIFISDSSLQSSTGGDGQQSGDRLFVEAFSNSKEADFDGDGVVNLHEAYLYRNIHYNSSLAPIVMPGEKQTDGTYDYLPISDIANGSDVSDMS